MSSTRKPLRSRFAAVRVRAAHRDYWSSEPRSEEWLLIEWPRQEVEPTRYWLSPLPAHTKLSDLVCLAKQRWIIERDDQELKQELGLGHYSMKDETGAAFTITLPSASRPMRSWWPNGAVFPPPLAPVKWTYPSLKCRPSSILGVRPVRVERHNPWSIATLRLTLGRALLRQGLSFLWSPILITQ